MKTKTAKKSVFILALTLVSTFLPSAFVYAQDTVSIKCDESHKPQGGVTVYNNTSNFCVTRDKNGNQVWLANPICPDGYEPDKNIDRCVNNNPSSDSGDGYDEYGNQTNPDAYDQSTQPATRPRTVNTNPAAVDDTPAQPAQLTKGCAGDADLYTGPGGICLPGNRFSAGVARCTSLGCVTTDVVRILLMLAGVVAVVVIIIGGFQYMLSAGNAEAAGKGKKTLLYAVGGLVAVIMSYVIVSAVTGSLTGGDLFSGSTGSTGTTNNGSSTRVDPNP